MKILVTSINFYPDHAGIALYSTDLPVFLAQQGAEVTMVSGFSYYPRWKKRKADQGALFRTETYDTLKVFRGYLYVPEKVTTLKRILHEFSFLCFAFINCLRSRKQDLVIMITPPLFLGFLGVFLKRLWDAPLVVHIQDFALEAAVSLGFVKKNLLIRFMERLERWNYRQADLIVPISEGMNEILRLKGVDPERIFTVYNWIDVSETSRKGRKGYISKKLPTLNRKLIIAYAGNIGTKQGIETLVNLAEATQDNTDIHYLVIGEGAEKEKLTQIVLDKNLHNITLHPFLGQEEYYNMLRDVDISFLAQKSSTGNIFFPSKLLGIMALAKPILVSADPDSELARFIVDNGCGLAAPPGDINTLKKHVEFFLRHPLEREKIGLQGMAAVRRFDRQAVLSPYFDRMTRLLKKN